MCSSGYTLPTGYATSGKRGSGPQCIVFSSLKYGGRGVNPEFSSWAPEKSQGSWGAYQPHKTRDGVTSSKKYKIETET